MEDTTLQVGSLDRSPKRSKFLIFFIASILVIVGAFGAWQFFGTSSQEEDELSSVPTPTEFQFPTDTPMPKVSPTAKPTATLSPTSTPKPTVSSVNPVDKTTGLDRSKLTVEVQNGSGVAGEAGKASDMLKGLGYNVSAVGNADNFDYTDTTIQVKSSKSDYLALLKKDLGSSYTIGTTSADLSTSSSADALVIVGK